MLIRCCFVFQGALGSPGSQGHPGDEGGPVRLNVFLTDGAIVWQCFHERQLSLSLLNPFMFLHIAFLRHVVLVFDCPFHCPVTTGREGSSRCQWNSGFPGVSWTKGCQGKDPNIQLQLNCSCQFLFFWFILHSSVTLFFPLFFRVLVGTREKRWLFVPSFFQSLLY